MDASDDETMAAFLDSGWEAVLEDFDGKHLSSLQQPFYKLAREKDNHAAHGLRILADACSLMLVLDRPSNPFKPFAIFQNKRSAIVDDFTESDISFFHRSLKS